MYGNGNGEKKRSRLRVGRKEEANVSELQKQGYQMVKEKGGRQVWERTSSASSAFEKPVKQKFAGTPEKTGSARKPIILTPDASTGNGGYPSKSKERVELKTKKPREGGSFAEKVFGPREKWIGSGRGKEQRQIDRQNKKNCRIGQGCYVGKKL